MEISTSLQSRFHQSFGGRKIIVTGGASFIGSNLVERLLGVGTKVTVLDNFSSGKLENLPVPSEMLIVKSVDLRDREVAFQEIRDCDFVFHLAAVHGGRGFIESDLVGKIDLIRRTQSI